ncbi:MAG: CDP-alcohol phosphatidyltransferase family protein, partial [Bacteroidota bacterium]
MRKHIPNAITLLNLFFGCCAIIMAIYYQYNWVYILIAASLIADFLDGLVARLLGAYSELGKQLDSLAD